MPVLWMTGTIRFRYLYIVCEGRFFFQLNTIINLNHRRTKSTNMIRQCGADNIHVPLSDDRQILFAELGRWSERIRTLSILSAGCGYYVVVLINDAWCQQSWSGHSLKETRVVVTNGFQIVLKTNWLVAIIEVSSCEHNEMQFGCTGERDLLVLRLPCHGTMFLAFLSISSELFVPKPSCMLYE